MLFKSALLLLPILASAAPTSLHARDDLSPVTDDSRAGIINQMFRYDEAADVIYGPGGKLDKDGFHPYPKGMDFSSYVSVSKRSELEERTLGLLLATTRALLGGVKGYQGGGGGGGGGGGNTNVNYNINVNGGGGGGGYYYNGPPRVNAGGFIEGPGWIWGSNGFHVNNGGSWRKRSVTSGSLQVRAGADIQDAFKPEAGTLNDLFKYDATNNILYGPGGHVGADGIFVPDGNGSGNEKRTFGLIALTTKLLLGGGRKVSGGGGGGGGGGGNTNYNYNINYNGGGGGYYGGGGGGGCPGGCGWYAQGAALVGPEAYWDYTGYHDGQYQPAKCAVC